MIDVGMGQKDIVHVGILYRQGSILIMLRSLLHTAIYKYLESCRMKIMQ